MTQKAKPETPPSSADQPSSEKKDRAEGRSPPPAITANPTTEDPPSRWRKRLFLLTAALAGLAVASYFLVPWVTTALNTVSTDDAYVNGHFTLVAPRVAGQVSKVLADDNYRVKRGDVLVELDPEPYQVQVAVKKAAR